MELTRDGLLHIERISADPEKRELASALIAEMDKPKVWDGAPEWATDARIRWTDRNGVTGHNDMYSQLYTRELPKTRAREIAEEYQERWLQSDSLKGVDVIEAAIEKALSEREAEK